MPLGSFTFFVTGGAHADAALGQEGSGEQGVAAVVPAADQEQHARPGQAPRPGSVRYIQALVRLRALRVRRQSYDSIAA